VCSSDLERLKIARELGATHVINPASANLVQSIREITGIGVEYALNTTSSPAVVRQAVDSLAPAGRCGIVASAEDRSELPLDMSVLLQGREVFGIIQGDALSHVFIPQMIELYKQGRFPFDKMIRFYSLEQINEAVADSENGKTIKAVLRPQDR
jgi:aryl-alcohol dehydrogenase